MTIVCGIPVSDAPRTRYKKPLRGPRYRPQRYVIRAKDFMSTAIAPTAGALTPFVVVAREAGLESWALAKLEPDGFREAHVTEQGGVSYVTPDGIAALAQSAEKKGYAVMAHSLRVLARQTRDTPSRALIAPAPKNAAPVYAWQHRKDCADLA
jgi:hypothetical protein